MYEYMLLMGACEAINILVRSFLHLIQSLRSQQTFFLLCFELRDKALTLI